MDMGLIVDIIVGFVVLASVLIAFYRGLIREVLTIFGIGGGLVASYIGGPLLLPITNNLLGVTEDGEVAYLFGILPYPILSFILSYGVVLIAFVIILSIISHFLSEFVKNLGLGALDRTLGIFFGVLRALLVLGLINLIPHYLLGDKQKEEWFENSHTYVYLEKTSEWMASFYPKSDDDKDSESLEQKIDDTTNIVSETRKKLEEMDVLSSMDDKDKAVNNDTSSQDGYRKEFRNKMDDLIEETINEQVPDKPQYNQ